MFTTVFFFVPADSFARLLCSVFLLVYVFFQCDLWGVITGFMNVIMLAFVLAFYYFISKKVRYLCLSSYLFSFSACLILLPSVTEEHSEGMHISAIFLFSSLSNYSLPLRAEEPQCLLLTFSYHLSPFHHPHYLPLLSVIHSWLPVSLLLSLLLTHHLSLSVSLVFSLSCRQQVSAAPPTHLHTSLSQYIILPPVRYCSMVPVTPVSVLI